MEYLHNLYAKGTESATIADRSFCLSMFISMFDFIDFNEFEHKE